MPLNIMLSRSPSGTSSAIGAMFLRDGQALAGQRGFGGLKRGRFDQPRISWNGVAFLNENDVAGNDLGGADRSAARRRE